MSAPGRPLEGLVVVDLTTFLSGPSATQLLGDLGAEVIKIESLHGDSSRGIPGHYVDGESAYYLSTNRNKLSISVDLKNAKGVQIVKDLIAQADIVIENFRPGVCSRLGLDEEALTTEHPRLVWASISGFGQEGPWRDRPAYDIIVQALSGVMSVTGHAGGRAARLGIPAGDVVAGLFAVIGVLSAIVGRETSGRGRIIDVSMLDGQLAMLSYQAVYALLSGAAPGPQGAAHDSIVTYRTFAASDGVEFVVAANTQRMWASLCEAAGLEHLLQDERFHDGSLRLENKQELLDVLEPRFREAPASVWVDKLRAKGVPTAPILDVIEALGASKASGRDLVIKLEREGVGFENVGNPVRFSEGPQGEDLYPPRLGEHTAQVLAGRLGFDSEKISQYAREGVVKVGAPASVTTAPARAEQ